MDENPYRAPQTEPGDMPQFPSKDENPGESPKVLVAVAAIIGALLLLQFALGKLVPLFWPDYSAD
jgi:hypothetical protein